MFTSPHLQLLLSVSLVVACIGCAASRGVATREPVKDPVVVEIVEQEERVATPDPEPVVDPLTPGYQFEAAEQWPEAIAFYGAVLRDQPANSTALHRLGVIATYRKDFAAAADYYRRAVELDPQNVTLLADTGYFMILQKQYEPAMAMLELAVTMDPENSLAVQNLATVSGLTGDIDEALMLFRRVLSPAEALVSLASIHEQRSEWQLALACYHEAHSVDPDVIIPEEVTTRVAELRRPPAVSYELDTVAVDAPVEEASTATDATPLPSRPLMARNAPAETKELSDELPIVAVGDETAFEDAANWFPDDVVAEVRVPHTEELVSAEWETDSPSLSESALETVASIHAARPPREAALDGCCPVALRDASQLVDGCPEFRCDHAGVTYTFATAEALQRFRNNPERYVPAAGGLDVVSVRHGKMRPGSIHYSTWFRNRLFLFTSADHVDEFRSDPLRYVELD